MTLVSPSPVIVYAEATPNPASMKFVINRSLIQTGATAEYTSGNNTSGSPLAAELFRFPFVKNVFISSNYVSITKKDTVIWEEILTPIREFLKEFIESGRSIVTELPKAEVAKDSSFRETTLVHTEHAAPSTETEHKIIEVLEQYIRPAVEQDGGMIAFKSFQEGRVTVEMKGACSGCPSSTMTLKAGIEGLLKRMVPGVEEVVAEAR